MQTKILMVEGKRAGMSSFAPGLQRKGYLVELVSTGKAATARLETWTPDIVIVDASTLRSTGRRICLTLIDVLDGNPIILIANPEYPSPEDTGVNLVLEHPFTIRKLVNRVKALLPGQSNHILKAGVIQLDLERNRVMCDDRDEPLTPRLASLLAAFMKEPDVVLEREYLFRTVWKTEYTVDTRTLDVHISWLRQALEENPRRPKYLKTIRGVGYRLDVEKSR